jgi:predicted PurR-regulated permease PerM
MGYTSLTYMETGRKTLIASSIVAGFVAILYLLYLSKTVLLYLIVALFFAISIDPLVEKLEKKGVKKIWASVITIFVLIAIVFGVVALIATPLFVQGQNLLDNLPGITTRIINDPSLSSTIAKYNLRGSLESLSGQTKLLFLGGSASLLSVAGNIARIVSGSVVILVITFLFLIEGEKIWSDLLGFFSAKDAHIFRRTGKQIRKAIAGFISGNLLISLIAGIVTLVTLLLLRVPYAFALSALVALFDLIPLIGAAIATIAVGFVALTKGVVVASIAVAVLLMYQFIEGHMIQPVVYSRSISLSPLFIVIASVLGAEIAGITGVLLAIPVGAIVQIVTKELYLHFVKNDHEVA